MNRTTAEINQRADELLDAIGEYVAVRLYYAGAAPSGRGADRLRETDEDLRKRLREALS